MWLKFVSVQIALFSVVQQSSLSFQHMSLSYNKSIYKQCMEIVANGFDI